MMFIQEEKNTKTSCFHCGAHCNEQHKLDGHSFCCNGCVAVYQLLSDHNLSDYYGLDEKTGKTPEYQGDFDWLKEKEVQESLYAFHEGDTANVLVQLPSIHCSACIFLLENLRNVNSGILDVEVNFTQKKARIFFKPNDIDLYELATLLQKIGYKPHFIKDKVNTEKSSKSDLVKRLTVAGFFFGNVMLLSFPEYLGGNLLEDQFGRFFGVLMLILSLPVLLYASNIYLISAWKSMRSKALNLDIPIALGILVLFGRSAYEVISQTGAGYFDSFTGFVFFLLLGRWFQNKTYAFIDFEKDIKSHLPLAVQVVGSGGTKYVPVDHLKKGQTVVLKNNEILPTDAVLASPNGAFDFSFVTGEAHPVEKKQGDRIYAGAKNLGTKTFLKLSTEVDHSYLSGLWKGKSSEDKRKNWRNRDARLTKVFLLILVFLTLSAGLVWWWLDASRVFMIITSILIVACPCALALSAPFTFGNMQRILGRNGWYLKDSFYLPELATVKHVVFDKTGTLTSDAYKVNYEGNSLSNDEKAAVRGMCEESNHPYSKAIVENFNAVESRSVEDFKEEPGKGVSSKIKGENWALKAHRESPSASSLWHNDQLIGVFHFNSEVDDRVIDLLVRLNPSFELHLLSGDGPKDMELFSKYIGSKYIHFNQSPYDKEQYIQSLKIEGTVLMVGDGINDTGALKVADIGVAVSDKDHQFTPVADAILKKSAIHKLDQFLGFTQKSNQVLLALYVFSILYNITGLYFAVTGLLTPLVAAIIMPLSSITIVVLATLLTNIYGKKL